MENYPLKVRKLYDEEVADVFNHFKGYQRGFVRIGQNGYFFNDRILADAPKIYNLELRTDDVFVVTFPKSGTTWTQELVWMVANDFDYKKSNAVPLPKRFPFLESSMISENEVVLDIVKKACGDDPEKLKVAESTSKDVIQLVNSMPSPRFIKTHLPFSMLPPNLLEKAKVVYVARDPRDVAVSFFHHSQFMPVLGFHGDFKAYWNFFKRDMIEWSPYLSHIKEAWALKDHPNMLFLFYEELSKDTAGVIHRVAKFLNKTVTEQQVTGLCDHLRFDNFKQNKSVNNDHLKTLGLITGDFNFVRQGKVGGWREYFDEEMTKEADQWMADGLQGTNISFPQ